MLDKKCNCEEKGNDVAKGLPLFMETPTCFLFSLTLGSVYWQPHCNLGLVQNQTVQFRVGAKLH